MKQLILACIIALTIPCMAFAKDKIPANPGMEIPAEVSQWIDGELAKAKRKSLMDFEAGEFFAMDTARLIGYIKGYDPVIAGFSTGIILASNDITREDFPVVVQIHEDGRFEGVFPMNYPKYSPVKFNDLEIFFYIQPGQTLAMLLDWEDFRMAETDWLHIFKNNRFKGAAAGINNELSAFYAQLPILSPGKIINGISDKKPDEAKSFLDELLSDYTQTHQRLLETKKFSEASKTILRNNYQIMYASYLFMYEFSNNSNQLPLEFYDFLQDIPMDNKELLSTKDFGLFIGRLEFCQPFDAWKEIYEAINPEYTTYTQYLFEKLNLPKTPEDETYLLMVDSHYSKLYAPEIAGETKIKLREEWNDVSEKFNERYKQYQESYERKYQDPFILFRELEVQRSKDSVYINELKLKPGIVYDMTKIRWFTTWKLFDNKKAVAWEILNAITSEIPESFLRKEADLLFLRNYPEEQQTAYELPDTPEAKIFKELIAPFKGKVLLVDFWATTCSPCVGNIQDSKTRREKYKDSSDVAFVFITSENESPSLERYNKFVEEQELVNSYRINADQYRYLRQLFRFNGIPRYILVDREGRILNDNMLHSGASHEMELIKAIKM